MSPGAFDRSPPFPQAAARSLADSQLRANLRQATSTIRLKRERLVSELADFEELRSAAAAIKDEALSRLDELLVKFEAALTARGGTVHFAPTAAEANSVVLGLVERAGANEVVKVKSMTTGETRLNEALAAAGVATAETDLAELIVQLGADLPSHIVVPAIHRNRSEVRRTFLEQMGSYGLAAPSSLSDEPADLAGAARSHLREKFLRADVGISGANFAIAETGSLVVVESEGNGRMCLTLPRVLVSVVGIDKLVPSFRDLEVFLQLLARSATGERMSPYTSLWTGPVAGDGPEEVHVVFVDNGRSSALSSPVGRQALRCIRCAACLNVCPVYERVGGHAYGSVYPGPIGAVLTPQLRGVASEAVNESLPFASTLCGACYEVCPVKIDIPRLLVHLRARSVERQASKGMSAERLAMDAVGAVLAGPKRMQLAEKLAGRIFAALAPHGKLGPLPGPLGRWTATRDAPVPARESFRDWWRHARPEGEREVGSDASSARAGKGPGAEGGRAGQQASGWAAFARKPWSLGRGSRPTRSLARPKPGPLPTAAAPSGREGVLSSIRAALGAAPYGHLKVPRSYKGASQPGALPPVELFVERVSEYQARATVVVGDGGAREAVEAALGRQGASRIVVPAGFPDEWLPKGALSARVDDGQLSVAELEGLDATVCCCSVAVAETGTVVLTGGPGQGRRVLSLLPDHLVLVVRAQQVVANVPDAVARLAGAPVQTWISGPSATSDIELDRVEGVHGPRKLDVVVVAG